MDKFELLEKVKGCLHYNDHRSIFSWLERARKNSSSDNFNKILIDVYTLIENTGFSEAGKIVLESLSAEVAEIRSHTAKIDFEKNRLKLVAEEDRQRAVKKRKDEELEIKVKEAITYLESIRASYLDIKREDLPVFARTKKIEILNEIKVKEAITYLESIRASYLDIKREDLPVFARTKKIEILNETKAAEAKAAKERFEEEHLQSVHSSFLSTHGIDTETRKLVSSTSKNRRRITHCYSCNRQLDGALHLNCSECQWIVCPSCGACGCGWRDNKGVRF